MLCKSLQNLRAAFKHTHRLWKKGFLVPCSYILALMSAQGTLRYTSANTYIPIFTYVCISICTHTHINLFLKKIKYIRNPLSHPTENAVTANGHIGHCIGTKEEQNYSFCTAEGKANPSTLNLDFCIMIFIHKCRHLYGYYDFPFGRWGKGCMYLENFYTNLRNAYCLSDQCGCFFAVFLFL